MIEGSYLIKFTSEKVLDGEPFEFSAEAYWNDEQFYLTATDFTDKSSIFRLGKPRIYCLKYLANHNGETSPTNIINKTAGIYAKTYASNVIYPLISQGYITCPEVNNCDSMIQNMTMSCTCSFILDFRILTA